MTPKERILAVLNRQPVNRLPVDLCGTRPKSPRLWQTHLQPRLKRWCDLIHAHGLRVFYHTDGAARPLIVLPGTPPENIFTIVETVHQSRND